MERKIITRESLEKLFNKLKSSGKVIYAPVRTDKGVNFKEVNQFGEISSDYIQTVQSAKGATFPKIEKLFDYKITKDGVQLEDVDLTKIPETVLWFLHPCDAAGFAALKAIFTWDFEDKIFTTRLNKLTVIGLSCNQHDSACFCTSVGLNPGSEKGSDILLTPLKNGEFLAEIVTDKGRDVAALESGLFREAGDINKEENLTVVPQQIEAQEIHDKLATAFENDIWAQQSFRCLGCGACAYVCPTCACFDIQDEGEMYKGGRIRCWDTCGLSLFTLHTSGHNPREEQNQRWRQRIMHKFSYMPDRLSVLGCVGCGRCSRACPVDMNILEHLKKIKEDI